MRLIVSGACGHMGLAVLRQMKRCAEPVILAAAIDPRGKGGCLQQIKQYSGPADAIIDFSDPSGARTLLRYAAVRRIPLVMGTTGLYAEQKDYMRRCAALVPIFYSENYAVGIGFLHRTLCSAAKVFPKAECQIVEVHRSRKVDVPSGTALALARALGKEVPIHSMRCAEIVGEHTVYLFLEGEVLVFSHRAQDRALFARGALSAAAFLQNRRPGLYGMEDLLS